MHSTPNHPVTPGARFRAAMEAERPLQVVGAINAYSALLARDTGYRALYLSGAGVANASFGLPDLGMTTLDDVAEDARRIAGAVDLPLLIDADTGFGDPGRAVRELVIAGAAGLHIEDQVESKRCGHRPGKRVVEVGLMVDRIAAAVDARPDRDFVLMARTDAHAVEGLNASIERSLRYVEAGADMIFAEALTTPEEYRLFTAAVGVPVLANVTEFGKTPMLTAAELGATGVRIVLYPLSAFRAMSAAAIRVYAAIRERGTQRDVLGSMQNREDLYRILDYDSFERMADEAAAREAGYEQHE